jgi:hypothetical protein
MRKFMLGAAMAAFIGLGGCATTSGTIAVASVQTAAQTACGFLPTAASVASLLTANPAVATAEAVAAIICGAVAAVPPPAAGKLRGTPTVTTTVVVNGKPVVITGTFTQQ